MTSTTIEPITVVIADVSRAMIDAVRSVIGSDERLRFAGSAQDADNLSPLLEEIEPTVLILDPEVFGRGAMDRLAKTVVDHPETGVVLTDLLDADDRSPARGPVDGTVVLSKLAAPEEWVDAILEVADRAGRPAPADHPPSTLGGELAGAFPRGVPTVTSTRAGRREPKS